MKSMKRNQRPFWYARYAGRTPVKDGSGNLTGEYAYSDPVAIQCVGNISAGTGSTESQPFGTSVAYDKVILLDGSKAPFDEFALLWVDKPPVMETDGTTKTPHDYEVSRISETLNSVLVAVRRVNASA